MPVVARLRPATRHPSARAPWLFAPSSREGTRQICIHRLTHSIRFLVPCRTTGAAAGRTRSNSSQRGCPELRELYLDCVDLCQPSAPLAALTWHSLCSCDAPDDMPAPLLSLAAAAPRLEALRVCGALSVRHAGVAAAAEGHPCLRRVYLRYVPDDDVTDDAWLHVKLAAGRVIRERS